MQDSQFSPIAKIKIVGVGGAGSNSVETMIADKIKGVEFIVANTDIQALNRSSASTKLHLGDNKRGLGAGANPEVGAKAASESLAEIKETLKGADMVIITAGMGGGTGTGAAPIFAKAARGIGALTIAIVTSPFTFEGNKRTKNAKAGAEKLLNNVDSLITISNNKLLEEFGDVPMKDSFIYADTILKQTVKTMTEIIAIPAHINLDFADVRTVMENKGAAIICIGRASGKDRATKAAVHAVSSPIIETSIKGASDAIVNITGSPNMTLKEINTAVSVITQAIGDDVNIIFGTSFKDEIEDEIMVSMIATGLESVRKITNEEKIQEVTQLIKTMEVELQDSQTREFLLKEPLQNSVKRDVDSIFQENTPRKPSGKKNAPTKSILPPWFTKQ